MDAYPPPPSYMRPPSGPPSGPPPVDPYHQYYQHPARPPVPPPAHSGPAWYSNQFYNPHSPSPPPPPPPQQWRPSSPHFPQGEPYSSSAYPPFPTPFKAGTNGNTQFPQQAGPPLPPPHPQANQEWGNPNWGYHQGQTSQANSNVEDWAVKAREWAAANEVQHSQSAAKPPSGQGYQQYPNHVLQQAAPGVSYQQFSAPLTTQPERYSNYAAGNESFPGGSSAGLSGQQNLHTSSNVHQQEVPYSYSSVAGKEESGNATQHGVHVSVPDNGGPVHAEQHMQYAYGDQTTAPPSNHSDYPLQFANRESSDYASIQNAWPPHAATGVVYPPIPSSSVPSIPQESSMAMPSVSGHTIPPFGAFSPPKLPHVGPPYAFGTKPPLHPAAAFMDDSYAASSAPPKKAPVPNWLKEELLKTKASLGRPSSGSFQERESLDDDLLYKPPVNADQPDEKSFSPSKTSDEEEEDEDEMDPERTAAINLEIRRISTEVLLKVTDELFDEIATKVINEDEAIPKDDSVQHNYKSSSSLPSAADPVNEASAKILVSVGGTNKKAGSGSPADVLGLSSYASDDDDADTDAASNGDADGSDGVERPGMGTRNDANQQPSPEPTKGMVDARLDPEVEVCDLAPQNNKSGLDQMIGSRRKDDGADSDKNVGLSASSGLEDDTSVSRTNHPDKTDSDKDAILDEPHRKNSGLKSDCNLRQYSNKSYGNDLSDSASRDRNRADETNPEKEKADSQNGSKDRVKQTGVKPAEKVKGSESIKKSTNLHVKCSADAEKHRRTNSKEDRGRNREKENGEDRSRHRQATDSSKDKRRRSPTCNGSSDDSIRKSSSRRRNVSPSLRSRRKRSSPSDDDSSDHSRRKSASRRRNRSPSPGKSRKRSPSPGKSRKRSPSPGKSRKRSPSPGKSRKRSQSPGKSRKRHVSSRSPHSKHSQRKHTLYSSHDSSRSKRSRSRSPRRLHRDK